MSGFVYGPVAPGRTDILSSLGTYPPLKDECTLPADSGVLYRHYEGIEGTAIATMLEHTLYPDSPAREAIIEDFFETPANICDNCGSTLQAWFTPPEDGPYTFYFASDNQGLLWLGDFPQPQAAAIANVPGW